jgi:hypothetical protein
MHLHPTRKLRSAFRPSRELVGQAQLGRRVDDSGDNGGLTHLDQLNVGRNNVGCRRLMVWHKQPPNYEKTIA